MYSPLKAAFSIGAGNISTYKYLLRTFQIINSSAKNSKDKIMR